MTIYRTNDGFEITAATDVEVIRQLRASSFCGKTSGKRNFMLQVAERVKIQTEQEIQTDSDEHFINSLITAGLLTRLN